MDLRLSAGRLCAQARRLHRQISPIFRYNLSVAVAVVKCSDGIYGIPQDAEARMFFYNKKLLRAAGYDNAFIEAMPARTLSGELTMDDVIDIANRVINKAKAQYGILHRP